MLSINKTRRVLFLMASIASISLVHGQLKKTQASWQQQVDYYINVTLDDTLHLLTGDIKMEYVNNSPDELTEIYIHLWPNAYSSKTTAFAKQMVENGNTDFHYAEKSEMGYIKDLDFSINGEKVTYALWNKHKDVVVISLKSPLKPGSKMFISTPFRTKIPGSFSRFGHEKQDYQITQWYPKPAVYDVNGWNPMPYLNQGEFYSEFGSFEVNITVPKNYVVASTGILKNQEEKDFLRNRAANPVNPFEPIETAKETKTLTYTQDQVHDFAWFTSKYFNLEMDEIELEADGEVKTVETYVFAPQKEINWTSDINKTLKFYSEHVGMYPYDHCTVVKGPLKAGGGMEYPMITVVAQLGKTVIVHEVGHNWFYGVLGTDERNYPWMDESINSFFEHKTIEKKDKKEDLGLEKVTLKKVENMGTMLLANLLERTQNHQAVGAHSEELTGMNYGAMVYGKGAYVFDYLRKYLGDDGFYMCFREYYQRWKFKHPLPDDMKAVFEEVVGEDLDWFFDGMIASDESIDLEIVSIRHDGDGGYYLKVKNHSSIPVPYRIGTYEGTSVDAEYIDELWVQGHQGEMEIHFEDVDGGGIYKLDPGNFITETNEKNNSIRISGPLKKVEPLDLKILSGRENPDASTLYLTPFIGWNDYNKWMIGANLSNMNVLGPALKYRIAPLFSFETNPVNGIGALSYEHFRNARLNKIELGINGQRFGTRYVGLLNTYSKVEPYAKLYFRGKKLRNRTDTYLKARFINVSYSTLFDESEQVELITNDNTGRRSFSQKDATRLTEILFKHENYRKINPFSIQVTAEVGSWGTMDLYRDTSAGENYTLETRESFAKISAELNYRISYSYKKKGLDIRVFGGYTIDDPQNGFYDYVISQSGGGNDYKYDHLLMNRGARTGVFANRILHRDLNLKLVGNFGNISNWSDWCMAVNLVSGLPGKLPFSVYADIFTFSNIETVGNNINDDPIGYSGGLQFNIIPSIFKIYMPLVNSEFITETQKIQGYDTFWNRMTFSFTLPINGLGSINKIMTKLN